MASIHQSYPQRDPIMSHDITVTFLGTTSGGGPSETRNCSSLVIDALGDASLWMVDCAEGTLRQFSQQPYYDAHRRLKIGKLTKIFITHMHADHVAGLLTILRNVLGIPKPPNHSHASPSSSTNEPPKIDIYGPRGLRRFLRLQLLLTHTHSEWRYAVHELLATGERPSVPSSFVLTSQDADTAEVDVEAASDEDGPLGNEAPGRDIVCDAQGFWREIVSEDSAGGLKSAGKIVVDAGPIEHRDPCIGYIFREVPKHPFVPAAPTPRKIVILGDTFDPSALVPLIEYPETHISSAASSRNDTDVPEDGDVLATLPTPVTLLIHEATDAYMPPSVDPQERTGRNRTAAIVDMKTRDRGHSTPAMAGAFAKRIGAEKLVLNHIGARFPAPPHHPRSPADKFRLACMREMERQAMNTWAPSIRTSVHAAYDFMRVVLSPNYPTPEDWTPSARGGQHSAYQTHSKGLRQDDSMTPAQTSLSEFSTSTTRAPPSIPTGPRALRKKVDTDVEMSDAATTSVDPLSSSRNPPLVSTTHSHSEAASGTSVSTEQIQHSTQTHFEASRDPASSSGSARPDKGKRSRSGEGGSGFNRGRKGNDRHHGSERGGGDGTHSMNSRPRDRRPQGGHSDEQHGTFKRARP